MLERTWGHGAWANASTVPMAAGRLIAAGSAASKSRPSCGRLITVGCCTQWVLSPPPRARHAGQLVVELRCRSASLSIGYAMAIHKPTAVGGTRVVGSGMRVGRPAGGSVMAAPDGTTQERLVPRRVVVGNLGYDVSFTRPKSYSLLLAFADSDSDTAAAAAVESVYTEAVGRTFGWLERQCAYVMPGQPTASSPAGVIATGPNLTGAALLEGRQAACGMMLLAYRDSWTRRRSWARWYCQCGITLEFLSGRSARQLTVPACGAALFASCRSWCGVLSSPRDS